MTLPTLTLTLNGMYARVSNLSSPNTRKRQLRLLAKLDANLACDGAQWQLWDVALADGQSMGDLERVLASRGMALIVDGLPAKGTSTYRARRKVGAYAAKGRVLGNGRTTMGRNKAKRRALTIAQSRWIDVMLDRVWRRFDLSAHLPADAVRPNWYAEIGRAETADEAIEHEWARQIRLQAARLAKANREGAANRAFARQLDCERTIARALDGIKPFLLLPELDDAQAAQLAALVNIVGLDVYGLMEGASERVEVVRLPDEVARDQAEWRERTGSDGAGFVAPCANGE